MLFYLIYWIYLKLNVMKIYTKTGDKGETALLGGKRVSKDCIEMQAIGEVDELNAILGVVVSMMSNSLEKHKNTLTRVQHKLFTIGSNLAAVQTDLIDVPHLTEEDIEMIEGWIDEMNGSLEPLQQFILPGGHTLASYCFYARAICRRAERQIVGLGHHYELDPFLGQFVNRLSDALFVLGRYINMRASVADVAWEK